MVNESMTVHKALTELKTIDDRLTRRFAEANGAFVSVKKKSAKSLSGESVEDYGNRAKSIYDSIVGLIDRRNAIRSAVLVSNANTKVTINGVEMSVACAIDYRQISIKRLTDLLSTLTDQYDNAKKDIDQKNKNLERRADDYITTLYGTKDRKDIGEEVNNTRTAFVEQQSAVMVDPLSAVKTMEELRDCIDTMKSEIDSALSVSNAITVINVSY